ncbi:uncharacterized protein [Halyomorpha halys]|uniref:uncharacterized protein isoform X1 n=1 Tax=Halyomorpha halys TaxID=286706 RepID=UPI0006D51574|nr:uncharacterized protein LOC106688888 isoform X1 [Halyomorpha halys]
MDREETKITSIIKPQETDQKKTNLSNRNLYTDAERQLFNASLAVHQFLKEARKDEANSVQARKKCRKLLKAGKILDARGVAKEALEASGRAYACSAVAKRIDWFVNKLNEDGFKPEIEVPLRALDSAVLCNDIWRAKRIINVIMTEIENVEAPDIPEAPTEKEITQYLKQIKDEVSILNKLNLEKKASEDSLDVLSYSYYENPDLGEFSDASSMVSSASKLRTTIQTKPKRTRKRFRVTERSLYE